MANLKDISTIPELEALEGTEKVLLNVDGSARQARVDLIKPKDEWDLDIVATLTRIGEYNDFYYDYEFKKVNSYENIVAKIRQGIVPKVRVICDALSYIDERGYDTYPMCETIDTIYAADMQCYGNIYFRSWGNMFTCQIGLDEDNECYIEVYWDF